jgi:hypothetical protein
MTVKESDLVGAEVIGISGGVHESLGELHLRLLDGKFVRIGAMYDEGLCIIEIKED